jgi:hypothetical protein
VCVLGGILISPFRQRLKMGAQARVIVDQSANSLSSIANAASFRRVICCQLPFAA